MMKTHLFSSWLNVSFSGLTGVKLLTVVLLLLPLLNEVVGQNCGKTGCSTKSDPCCSKYGYCGNSVDHCAKENGCLSGCWTKPAVTTNGNCKSAGCATNVNGPCCGSNGNCGRTADSCDPRKGCVSGCWSAADGCKLNGCGEFKSTAPCCSQWGYCGKTEPYCSLAQGCVSGCWPSNTNYNNRVANCKRDGCPDKNYPCCSQWGHCGSTAAYCDKSQGCKSGCWATAGPKDLVGRLVHEGFIANTRSATSWLNARNLFFDVVNALYQQPAMSGQKSVWNTAKSQKSSAESSRDYYWLGDPRTYIDNVKVSDKASQDALKVLSMSSIRLVATKPQECTGSEKSTFCVFSNPAPTKATLGCTRYNCYFSPGSPCLTRSGKIARCSSPTFFSNNKIQCPALSCVPAGKRYIDAEVIAALRKKRDLAGSYYIDLIRSFINKKRSSSTTTSSLSNVLKSTRKRIGSDPNLLDLRDIGKRAVCSSTQICEQCGVDSDTFTSECSANFKGTNLCCLCAFDFGIDTWSM